MARAALHRLAAAAARCWSHELSKLAWIVIFGVARRSLSCWIDGLD
jgi:hypothetical protein